jgi:hypothetical protein
MFHSRAVQSVLVGCLATLASFCALQARGGETYSIVAQSTRSSAATGRRPLAERIAAANLPIIVQATEAAPLVHAAAPEPENVAVAAVAIDEKEMQAAAAAARPEEKSFSPQSAVRALWRAATGSRAGTVTR